METTKKKTLLVITPGRQVHYESAFHILVAETGEHLASHYCSNHVFAYGDLYNHRPERKEEWSIRFGELDVKYIDETDITEEELSRRNRSWHESLPKVVSDRFNPEMTDGNTNES